MASLHRAARLRFDRCTTAPETRPLPAVSRAHPPGRRPIVQRCPTGGGEAVIPRPVVRGPLAVALPRSRSLPYPPPDRFGRTTAGYVDHPQAPMEFRHWPGTAPGPAGDTPFATPPAIQLRSPRYKYVLGRNRLPVSHFPNRFPVLKPVTGFPVPV